MRPLTMILVSLLFACSGFDNEDVSGAQYRSLIGKRYETLAEMRVHGLSQARGPNRVVEEFVITNLPGFGGPEVVRTSPLAVGTVITIQKALLCTSCPGAGPEFVVSAEPSQTDAGISLKLRGVGDGIMVEGGGSIDLDPALFRALERRDP